jgi:prevent-host-death family protein
MPNMQMIGSRQASNRFGSLLNTVQEGQATTITRNDKGVAVIISLLDFQLLGGEKSLLERRAKYMDKQREALTQTLDDMRQQSEQNGLTQEILNDIINDK